MKAKTITNRIIAAKITMLISTVTFCVSVPSILVTENVLYVALFIISGTIWLFSYIGLHQLRKKLAARQFYEQEEPFLKRDMRGKHPLVMPADAERFPAWAKKKLDALNDSYNHIADNLSTLQEGLLETLKQEGDSKAYKDRMELYLSTVDLLTEIIADAEALPELVSKEKAYAIVKMLQTAAKARELRRNVRVLTGRGYNLVKEREVLDMIAADLSGFKERLRAGDVEAAHDFLAYLDPMLTAGTTEVLIGVEERIELIHHRLFLNEAGLAEATEYLSEAKFSWYGTLSSKYNRYKEKNPSTEQEEKFLEPSKVDEKLNEAEMALIKARYNSPASGRNLTDLKEGKSSYEYALSLIAEVERNNDRVELLPD